MYSELHFYARLPSAMTAIVADQRVRLSLFLHVCLSLSLEWSYVANLFRISYIGLTFDGGDE